MRKAVLTFTLSLFVFLGLAQIKSKSGIKTYTGFYTFYCDISVDKIYLELDRLNEDFLYINSLASGIGSNDIGLDRGKLGQKRLVRFERAGNKILLVQPNLMYRANSNNELERKSVEQAFAKSVLYGFKIIEESKRALIIDITPFLMEDSNGIIQTLIKIKDKNNEIRRQIFQLINPFIS